MSVESDKLDYEPYCWGQCTYWYRPSTKNFEVFGAPITRYNYHLYSVGGVWIAEMKQPGEPTPVLILSGLSIFRGWSLRELLALVNILSTQDIHMSVFSTPDETERNSIVKQAQQLSEAAPSWMDVLEDSILG